MKLRARTLGIIGATVVATGVTLGFGLAGSFAADDTDQDTPTTVAMPMAGMDGMDGMDGMADMADMADMATMHQMMQEMMAGAGDGAMPATCVQAAASMPDTPAGNQAQHSEHHEEAGS